MEIKENKKTSVFTIIIITFIITTLVVSAVFLVKEYYFEDNTKKPANNNINVTPVKKEYKISDYVTIESITENAEKFKSFDLKKVTFKNLPVTLTEDFLNKQKTTIDMLTDPEIEGIQEAEIGDIDVTTTIYTGIKDNILYVSSGVDMAMESFTSVAIDLENNRVLTLGDVINQYDLHKLANKLFDSFFGDSSEYSKYTDDDILSISDLEDDNINNEIKVKTVLANKESYIQTIYTLLLGVSENKPVIDEENNNQDVYGGPLQGFYIKNDKVYLKYYKSYLISLYIHLYYGGGDEPMSVLELEK